MIRIRAGLLHCTSQVAPIGIVHKFCGGPSSPVGLRSPLSAFGAGDVAVRYARDEGGFDCPVLHLARPPGVLKGVSRVPHSRRRVQARVKQGMPALRGRHTLLDLRGQADTEVPPYPLDPGLLRSL